MLCYFCERITSLALPLAGRRLGMEARLMAGKRQGGGLALNFKMNYEQMHEFVT
jgi:hypothetical protein